jgi:hypothetical protein
MGTHTSVASDDLAGRQRLHRPVGVVAGLPQLVAVLLVGRLVERPAALFGRDGAEQFRLLLDAGRGAVELDEQRVGLLQPQPRIGVEGAHMDLVDELDARHRNAALDGGDDRPAGGVDRRERANAGGDRFGDAVELHPISVMIPSVPSEPTSSRVRS